MPSGADPITIGARELAPAEGGRSLDGDRKIASFVRKGLEAQGFAVSVCRNGDEGLELAAAGPLRYNAPTARAPFPRLP